MPKYDITVKLIGTDGNAFAIMGRVLKEMKRAKVTFEDQHKFKEEAMNGDYGNLLRTCMKWVNVK